MRQLSIALRVLLALITVAVLNGCSDPPRYQFVVKPDRVPMGTREIEIRLRNNLGGTIVEDAEIKATGLGMSADGLSQTRGGIQLVGSNALGSYLFRVTFPKKGRWRLSLQADVPGEPAPVKGAVVLTVE